MIPKANIIYNENCLATMNRLPDSCIDLVVTSPPYDDLRVYNGFSFDFVNVAKELYRIMKNGSVIVWVVGDTMKNGNKSLTSFRQCLYFQSLGFNVYDVMIYQKAGGSPPHKNRYNSCFEYMFILSKGKPKSINLINDRINKNAGQYNYSPVIKREPDGTIGTRKAKPKRIIPQFSVRYNIWCYAPGFNNSTTDKIAFNHPAIFPERLAQDHIISWSNEGDIIYDPFTGSGTTIKMALLNKRFAIGSEISSEYCEIIKERIGSGYNLQFIK